MATMALARASPLTSTALGLTVSPPRTAFVGLRVGGSSAAPFPGLAVAPPPAGTGETAVVRMAKSEQELEEIRAMTTEQLEEEVVDLKGELFLLRLKRSARQEFKSSEFGRMRKRIARLLTVKTERVIEQGINKRLSRKLDRKWKQSIVVKTTTISKGE